MGRKNRRRKNNKGSAATAPHQGPQETADVSKPTNPNVLRPNNNRKELTVSTQEEGLSKRSVTQKTSEISTNHVVSPVSQFLGTPPPKKSATIVLEEKGETTKRSLITNQPETDRPLDESRPIKEEIGTTTSTDNNDNVVTTTPPLTTQQQRTINSHEETESKHSLDQNTDGEIEPKKINQQKTYVVDDDQKKDTKEISLTASPSSPEKTTISSDDFSSVPHPNDLKRVLMDAQSDLSNAKFPGIIGNTVINPIRENFLTPALGICTDVIPVVSAKIPLPFTDEVSAFTLGVSFNAVRVGYGIFHKL